MAKNLTPEEVRKAVITKLIKDETVTITDVIDTVIELNGFVGVGIISLGDSIKRYCDNKASQTSRFSQEALLNG